MFKNLLISLIFFLYSVISFSEVPHSYVTENPKKEVQKVETFKQRDKADLNLSVTKLKTKEIEGKLVNGKLIFDITDKKDIQEGNILVTQGTPYKPNNARVRSASPTQILEATKEANKLEVTGENLQNVYVNVLDGKGQLAGIYKNILKNRIFQVRDKNFYVNFEIDDDYDNEPIIFEWTNYRTETNKGFKFINTNGRTFRYYNSFYMDYPLFPDFQYIGNIFINGKKVFEAEKSNKPDKYGFPYVHSQNNVPSVQYSSEEIEVEFLGEGDTWKLKLNKYPQKDFTINTSLYLRYRHRGVNNGGTTLISQGVTTSHYTYNFKYIVKTLKGNSTLTFAEYYPVNEFVQFTANPTIQNAQPLALDNSIRDVTLETTGKGLVAMQQGDKLTVDGHQVVIGAGGNIGPQKLTIGNVKYTYEVKNGKFRIALNEWGVLEPNRTIPIKIVRNENGSDKSLAEHNLTIKAPRKVAGTVNLKLNQDYNIKSFINFNGINLNAPGQASLEQPIAPGVSLTSVSGQGIPFMKEGDILQINDGLTRAVKSFTVGANGNLAKQQVSLKSGDLIIYAESGKLRVSAINWVLNKPIKASISLVRGTNKIMDHNLEIKVPDAPFKVTKKGILDFGNVTAGTKRTAETDIGIEMMINDVEIVEFKLKDPQPILENLATGDTLAVDKIEYLVIQKDDKKYDIRLKGNLTIPEATKSGTYTGSTTVQLKLR